jgi:hypothetical protein
VQQSIDRVFRVTHRDPSIRVQGTLVPPFRLAAARKDGTPFDCVGRLDFRGPGAGGAEGDVTILGESAHAPLVCRHPDIVGYGSRCEPNRGGY